MRLIIYREPSRGNILFEKIYLIYEQNDDNFQQLFLTKTQKGVLLKILLEIKSN